MTSNSKRPRSTSTTTEPAASRLCWFGRGGCDTDNKGAQELPVVLSRQVCTFLEPLWLLTSFVLVNRAVRSLVSTHFSKLRALTVPARWFVAVRTHLPHICGLRQSSLPQTLPLRAGRLEQNDESSRLAVGQFCALITRQVEEDHPPLTELELNDGDVVLHEDSQQLIEELLLKLCSKSLKRLRLRGPLFISFVPPLWTTKCLADLATQCSQLTDLDLEVDTQTQVQALLRGTTTGTCGAPALPNLTSLSLGSVTDATWLRGLETLTALTRLHLSSEPHGGAQMRNLQLFTTLLAPLDQLIDLAIDGDSEGALNGDLPQAAARVEYRHGHNLERLRLAYINPIGFMPPKEDGRSRLTVLQAFNGVLQPDLARDVLPRCPRLQTLTVRTRAINHPFPADTVWPSALTHLSTSGPIEGPASLFQQCPYLESVVLGDGERAADIFASPRDGPLSRQAMAYLKVAGLGCRQPPVGADHKSSMAVPECFAWPKLQTLCLDRVAVPRVLGLPGTPFPNVCELEWETVETAVGELAHVLLKLDLGVLLRHKMPALQRLYLHNFQFVNQRSCFNSNIPQEPPWTSSLTDIHISALGGDRNNIDAMLPALLHSCQGTLRRFFSGSVVTFAVLTQAMRRRTWPCLESIELYKSEPTGGGHTVHETADLYPVLSQPALRRLNLGLAIAPELRSRLLAWQRKLPYVERIQQGQLRVTEERPDQQPWEVQLPESV